MIDTKKYIYIITIKFINNPFSMAYERKSNGKSETVDYELDPDHDDNYDNE